MEIKTILSTKNPQLLLLLLIGFFFFYLHPYYGIRHDSILYLGQALLQHYPASLSQDLFFKYGSQEKYSLFPQIIAIALDFWRPAELFKVLTLFSTATFIICSFSLIKTLFPPKIHLYALLGIICLPAYYSSGSIFSYNEIFFTGRSLADPLVLGAAAAWIGGKRRLSFTLTLVAFTLHPLQAFPLIIIGISHYILKKNEKSFTPYLLATIILCAALYILIISGFLQKIDTDWMNELSQSSPHLFVGLWDRASFNSLILDIFIVYLVINHTSGAVRVLAKSVLLGTLFALIGSIVFTDFLHLALAGSAQIWRTMWLLHWLAMASLPWLLLLHWNHDQSQQKARTGLILAIIFLALQLGGGGHSTTLIAALITIYFSWESIFSRIKTPSLSWISILGWVVAIIILIKYFLYVWYKYKTGLSQPTPPRLSFMLLTHPANAAAVAFCSIWIWKRYEKIRGILLLFATFAVIYSITQWDQRSPWTKSIESQQSNELIFGKKLDQSKDIYWEGELLAPWIILNQPSFYEGAQRAGLIFNRATAIEARSREDLLSHFNFNLELCTVINTLNKNQKCTIEAKLMKNVCIAKPSLGYWVMSSKVNFPDEGAWTMTKGQNQNDKITYHLYSCKELLKNKSL